MLSLILNIGKITRREIHFVAHLVPGLLASAPCHFDCVPEGLKVVLWYWPFCHIHSPSYILLFLFFLEYVYTVLIISQNKTYLYAHQNNETISAIVATLLATVSCV